jgi:hypothetical protein
MWFLVHAVTDAVWLLFLVSLVSLLSTTVTLLFVFLFFPSRTMTCACSSPPPTAATSPLMRGGYKATKRNLKYLRRYKAGKSIGFTMRSSLKAKGLIPRANGTYRVSEKYRTKKGGPPGGPSGRQASRHPLPQPPGRHAPSQVSEKYRTKNKTRKQNVRR